MPKQIALLVVKAPALGRMLFRTTWAASRKMVKPLGNDDTAVGRCRGLMTNIPLAKQAHDDRSAPSMSVKSYVDGLLQAHKVVVFSKSYCPYCHKARAALETQNLKPGTLEWIEIDGRPDCSEIQDYLQSLTGARSVPRVFINQKFFGGGDETAAAAKNGKLAALLKEAQAI